MSELRLAVVTTTVVLDEDDDPQMLVGSIGEAVCAHFGGNHHVPEVCPRTFSQEVVVMEVGVE